MAKRTESGDRIQESSVHDLFSEEEDESEERTGGQENGHTHDDDSGIGIIRWIKSEIEYESRDGSEHAEDDHQGNEDFGVHISYLGYLGYFS